MKPFFKNFLIILALAEVITIVTTVTLYYLWPLFRLFTPMAAELLIVLVGIAALAGFQVGLWRLVSKHWRGM